MKNIEEKASVLFFKNLVKMKEPIFIVCKD